MTRRGITAPTRRAWWLLVPLLLALFPPFAQAANYSFYVEQGTLTVNGAGGGTLAVWGYTTSPGAPPMIPGPRIEARENETVTVTVHNRRNQPHNFVVRGLTSDSASIPAGGVKTYTFTPTQGGTYLYSDTLNSSVNRAMGLYGAVVVRPADGSQRAWTGGRSFNLERTWVVSDMDKLRWNDVASKGGSVNTSVYKPNFFLMNGQGGFDGMHDPNSVAAGKTGNIALIRIVNAGQFNQSLHFHGFHFEVVDVDGKRLSPIEWGDTINVKAGTTAMVLYQLAPGIYPMHIHTAQMETANGVYLNGVATLMVGQ